MRCAVWGLKILMVVHCLQLFSDHCLVLNISSWCGGVEVEELQCRYIHTRRHLCRKLTDAGNLRHWWPNTQPQPVCGAVNKLCILIKVSPLLKWSLQTLCLGPVDHGDSVFLANNRATEAQRKITDGFAPVFCLVILFWEPKGNKKIKKNDPPCFVYFICSVIPSMNINMKATPYEQSRSVNKHSSDDTFKPHSLNFRFTSTTTSHRISRATATHSHCSLFHLCFKASCLSFLSFFSCDDKILFWEMVWHSAMHVHFHQCYEVCECNDVQDYGHFHSVLKKPAIYKWGGGAPERVLKEGVLMWLSEM